MLKNIKGEEIRRLPHAKEFALVMAKLGAKRADEVRRFLNDIIDNLPPDKKTGKRTFNSSHLGSKLSPWPSPLVYLYDVTREMLGSNVDEEDVQDRSGMLFGLFVWEIMMSRDDDWVFWDPNLDPRDPNREVAGKVYFEQQR
jgi:hypothetical protein